MPRTRRNIVLLVSGVAVAAVLAGSLPLLAGDKPELTLTAATDTTSTPVRTDGDNSAKSTLATCPALCERNPAGWRDAVVSFDVKGVPSGATGVTAQLWLYSWKPFPTATTAHVPTIVNRRVRPDSSATRRPLRRRRRRRRRKTRPWSAGGRTSVPMSRSPANGPA